MRNAIREAIFDHKMFEPDAGGSSYGIDSIRRNEATWPFKVNDIQKEVDLMTSQGLIELSFSTTHWSATRKGLKTREQLWQSRGLRHPALVQQNGSLQHLVLALVISGHKAVEGDDNRTFIEDRLSLFLWKHREEEITEALECLIGQGLVGRCDHRLYRDRNLFVKADGRIRYAEEVVPQLGLIPPMSILAPLEEESPPFQEIKLTSTFADNLHYRWEEARRCTQAEAWLAASILYGSILETVLLDILHRHRQLAMKCLKAPKDKGGKTTPVENWRLQSMLDVACELGWIDPNLGRYGHALRDLRNLIHPSKQIQERSKPDLSLVNISKLVVETVIESLARNLVDDTRQDVHG